MIPAVNKMVNDNFEYIHVNYNRRKTAELKAILEKAALMQADRSRTGGMFHAPKSSPWGEVQSCETLCPGVFLVSTASHGGTMVANEVAAVLSPAAKKCGFKDKGYICYEEDAQESVVLRELLDKKLWKIPDRIKDKGQFEENLNQSIRQYHPEYWRRAKFTSFSYSSIVAFAPVRILLFMMSWRSLNLVQI